MVHALQALCGLLTADASRIVAACETTMSELAPALVAAVVSKVGAVRECGVEATGLVSELLVRGPGLLTVLVAFSFSFTESTFVT